MKESTIKKFNLIAFIILPITIVFITIMICILGGSLLFSPNLDSDAVTAQTQSGYLWQVLEVTDGGYAYVIYSIDSPYRFDDNHLIAFRGQSVEAIEDEIVPCYSNSMTTSYWEGNGAKIDFTTTQNFKVYLEDVESRTYVSEAPDSEMIKENFAQITTYHLSDYMGYEREDKQGIGLATVIFDICVAFVAVIVLVAELLIALVLKLTVFKVKMKNN